ncbi:MAG: hydroxymethylpyrimidine/phosphomethylpyrimidine kinase [Chromatiales bacterium]|jgi:hydroxymethylpyrimidine/phosphomethylpyrimidine kinase
MQSEVNSHPVILVIGGHDPSGGAGIQADIESLAANGAHALTLISCLTLQDSCNVRAVHPVEAALLARQAELLLADSAVAAIKIGLLGSREIAETVAALLRAHPGIPVVLDPVLAAGGGSDLAGVALLRSLRERLLPYCDLITPNTTEALRLSGLGGDAPAQACAERLLDLGANAVLITGTHELVEASEITHRLYRPGTPTLSLSSRRLPGEYHGSGCTLAATITARLAQGEPLEQAVENALDFTWQTLRHAFHSGRCQATPNRFYHLIGAIQQQDG